MKKMYLLCVLILISFSLYSQDIKFKKGKILIDKVECLNYSGDANNVEISTLDGNNTIILKFIRTGIGFNGGLYNKIIFLEDSKSLTTRSYIFTKKLLVEKLLSEEVLKDCSIHSEKIDKFIVKFDEGIEETLIRN